MFASVIHDEVSHDAPGASTGPGLPIASQVARSHGRAVAFNPAEACLRALLCPPLASEVRR